MNFEDAKLCTVWNYGVQIDMKQNSENLQAWVNLGLHSSKILYDKSNSQFNMSKMNADIFLITYEIR